VFSRCRSIVSHGQRSLTDVFKPLVTNPQPVSPAVATSFDLFGTLVAVDPPADPAAAVGAELAALDVAVPADWADAYGESHIDAPTGAEIPLPAHVSAALGSRGVDAPNNAARRAVVNAFDPAVTTRPGALEAVDAAREAGPVGLLSNCSVPELVGRTLIRSALGREAFDAVVTSVGCGWRKPDHRAFAAVASRLGVDPTELVHVGDTPATDGGITDCGGTFLDVGETPLSALGERLGGRDGSRSSDRDSDRSSDREDERSDREADPHNGDTPCR
jgi:FMN phosphatase YigB (HAD superfamily)